MTLMQPLRKKECEKSYEADFFSLNTDHKVFNCLWFKVSVESKVEAHTCLEKVVVDFPLIK